MVGLTGFSAGLCAQPETFHSAISEVEWHVDASVFECNLVQPIPHFGTATFSRRAGENQRFYLRQNNRHLSPGRAQLSARHPVWRESPEPRLLTEVDLSEGEELVRLGRLESQPLMAELRQGKRLVLTRGAWRGQEAPVEVIMDPVGFRSALEHYQHCLAELLPVNYDQVARTALYYSLGDHELPEEGLEQLDLVALYASEDNRVSAFYVDGHTDGIGLRADNLELSRKRAEAVAEYLVSRGVDPRKVTTRWHGERYPVASNREPEGRAQNRRVTVRLERADDRFSAR